jgi:hypothetical protein
MTLQSKLVAKCTCTPMPPPVNVTAPKYALSNIYSIGIFLKIHMLFTLFCDLFVHHHQFISRIPLYEAQSHFFLSLSIKYLNRKSAGLGTLLYIPLRHDLQKLGEPAEHSKTV